MRGPRSNPRWLVSLLSLVLLACACVTGALCAAAVGATSAAAAAKNTTSATVPTTATATTATDTTGTQTTPPAITLPIKPVTTSTTTTPQSVQIQATQTAASEPLPTGFLGFSVEVSAIHSYLGRDPHALNPIFEQLLEGVDQGFAPVLRIGGNTTDYSYFPTPGWIPPVGTSYAITPDWLSTVGALSKQTGARLILGINQADAEPQMSAVEARALVNSIGISHIDALEIGNEPDLYPTGPWYTLGDIGANMYRRTPYRYGTYLTDAVRWKELLPNVPLAGPALATLSWMNNISTLTTAIPNLAMVTAHRYPLSACTTNPASASYPSVSSLLSSAATEGLASPLAPYAQSLSGDNIPLRIDELNSASCEGKAGLSNTFASSLWLLNELFDMAQAGVAGINIHTLPGSNYAPFTFTQSGGSWTGQVNPVYYGMLMFAQAFPPGADLISVNDSSTANVGDVKAFTTQSPDGTLRTTVINEDQSRPANVTLSLPYDGSLSTLALTAPSMTATTGVQLGGQSFANPTTTGTLPAPAFGSLAPSGPSTYSFTVPAASALLLSGAQTPQRR